MSLFQHVVKEEEANIRIDKLLTKVNPDQSRSQIQTWIMKQLVTVNNQYIKANYRCQTDDEINWSIPEIKALSIIPENIPLEVIYEDDDLLVVNKPRGMVVHPTADHQKGTLVHALLYQCDQLSDVNGVERPGIVHRIDKDTGGLLIVAKKNDIHIALTKQFVAKEIDRIYEAIVHGVIDHDTGLIDAPIGRDPNNRLRMGVIDQGKPAITHFHVLARFKDYSHIECKLETGRTHQIRVHMNYIGHPLVGDYKYTKLKTINVEGQALFSKRIGFMHPRKHEWMQFEVGQPDYLQKIITEIERKS